MVFPVGPGDGAVWPVHLTGPLAQPGGQRLGFAQRRGRVRRQQQRRRVQPLRKSRRTSRRSPARAIARWGTCRPPIPPVQAITLSRKDPGSSGLTRQAVTTTSSSSSVALSQSSTSNPSSRNACNSLRQLATKPPGPHLATRFRARWARAPPRRPRSPHHRVGVPVRTAGDHCLLRRTHQRPCRFRGQGRLLGHQLGRGAVTVPARPDVRAVDLGSSADADRAARLSASTPQQARST